jgi:RND family efflux transporter MFP subunit
MSAHPLPPSRFVARVVVPVALLAGFAGLLAWAGRGALRRARPVEVAPVMLVELDGAAVGEDDARSAIPSDAIAAPGWVEPDPAPVEARALRDGVVDAVLVREGARVEAGQVIARLEHAGESIAVSRREAELQAARARLEQRRIERTAAARHLELRTAPRLALAEAEAGVVGSRAALGALVARAGEAEAKARSARDLAERRAALVAGGAAAEGVVRRPAPAAVALARAVVAIEASIGEARAAVAQAEARLHAARTVIDEPVDESRAADAAKAAEAEAAAQVALAEAQLAEARLALARSEIRAPIGGLVLDHPVHAGGATGPKGPPVARLYDPRRLQVRCDVPAREVERLAIGARAEITAEGLRGAVFAGRVARIVPLGDVAKNTHECKVEILAADGPLPDALRPDLLVRVRISTSDGGQGPAGFEGTAVPTAAIRGEGDEVHVLVAAPVDGGARCERRRVTVGRARDDGWTELLEGPPAGDRVVLDPLVREGEFVDPRDRMEAAS